MKSDTLSTLPTYTASGTITVDQMYVRYQIPVGAVGVPITLIHGCCLTGKTWETTPDGRMGWDEYFVRHGHPTYVIDQVWRGRSAADPSAINAVRSGKAAVDQLPTVFSAGHEGAWATSVAWSPSGQRILTGGGPPGRYTYKLWDVASGNVVSTLTEEPEPIPHGVAFLDARPALRRAGNIEDGPRDEAEKSCGCLHDCSELWRIANQWPSLIMIAFRRGGVNRASGRGTAGGGHGSGSAGSHLGSCSLPSVTRPGSPPRR